MLNSIDRCIHSYTFLAFYFHTWVKGFLLNCYVAILLITVNHLRYIFKLFYHLHLSVRLDNMGPRVIESIRYTSKTHFTLKDFASILAMNVFGRSVVRVWAVLVTPKILRCITLWQMFNLDFWISVYDRVWAL